MYSRLPNLVLGFHGCDKKIGEKVISGEINHLGISQNKYDWLGHGIYFWENNPKRANEYANLLKDNPKYTKGIIKEPFVIGAVIDLGYCLNLLESASLSLLKTSYIKLKDYHEKINKEIPFNTKLDKGGFPIFRQLDCAVVETLHTLTKIAGETPFDSVRGLFVEGKPLYENSGFNEKNHIQLCIRNPNCIKGYFRVIDEDNNYPIP